MRDFLLSLSKYLYVICFLWLTACYSDQPSGDEIAPIPTNSRATTQNKIQFLSDVIDENPKVADYYYRRAFLYLNINKERLAQTDIEKAIQIDSTQGKYHYVHAQILDIMEAPKNALVAAKKAEKQGEEAIELNMLLGKLYFQNQIPDKSVIHLKKMEKVYSKRPEIHYYKGKSYHKLRDTIRAVASFITAMQLRADYPEVYEATAQLFNDYGKPRTALRYLYKGIRKSKKNAHLYFIAGHTNRRLQRHNEALRCFSNAIKSDSTYWKASHYLANYFLRKQQISKGIRYLEITLGINPELRNGYLRLGWLYENYKKKYQIALKQYQKAKIKDSNNQAIDKSIARVEQKIKEQEYRKTPEYREKMRRRLQRQAEEQLSIENPAEEEIVPE